MTTPSICTRSIAAAVAISLAGYFAPVVSAQTTATTVPVGFITKTVPAAVSAGNPSSVVISVPLYATAAFTSAVASVDSATQFTMASAAWTAGQFATAASPFLVRVKTGVSAGLFFAISANTANQLAVILPPSVSTLVGVLSVGDSCEILPANTLGSVFGTAATPPVLTSGGTANTADNVLIWNGASWDTYFWTGALGSPVNIWKRSGTTDRSNTIIYPDDAVFVIRRDTSSAASITLMGTVPSTVEKSEIPAGSVALSNRFPVDTTLGALGLQNISGWVAGATANTSDNVFVWNGSTWDTYFWTGAVGSPVNIWKRTGTTDRSNTPIPAGTGVFVTHGGSLVTLSQNLPYTP